MSKPHTDPHTAYVLAMAFAADCHQTVSDMKRRLACSLPYDADVNAAQARRLVTESRRAA